MAKKRRPSGVAVDSSGGPVVDPTQNVIDLNEASVKRLDDLRAMESKSTRRMVLSESRHLKEVADIRSRHYRELRTSEAGRIDAILINIAETAQLTAAAAETRATTLATQVTSSADALRSQVAAAAQASNDTLDRRFGPIQASIEEIRKFQFETQGGKAGVIETRAADADLRPMADAIAKLAEIQAVALGKQQQVVETRAVSMQTIATIALFATVLGALLAKALGF